MLSRGSVGLAFDAFSENLHKVVSVSHRDELNLTVLESHRGLRLLVRIGFFGRGARYQALELSLELSSILGRVSLGQDFDFGLRGDDALEKSLTGQAAECHISHRVGNFQGEEAIKFRAWLRVLLTSALDDLQFRDLRLELLRCCIGLHNCSQLLLRYLVWTVVVFGVLCSHY